MRVNATMRHQQFFFWHIIVDQASHGPIIQECVLFLKFGRWDIVFHIYMCVFRCTPFIRSQHYGSSHHSSHIAPSQLSTGPVCVWGLRRVCEPESSVWLQTGLFWWLWWKGLWYVCVVLHIKCSIHISFSLTHIRICRFLSRSQNVSVMDRCSFEGGKLCGWTPDNPKPPVPLHAFQWLIGQGETIYHGEEYHRPVNDHTL